MTPGKITAAAPLFSVLIPTYNQEGFLPAALESLLAQSLGDWEAVIVNDGSADGTAAVMERFAAVDPRFRTFHQPNGGVGAALNAALAQARGEWICWLSSDDLFEPDKLATHLDAIRKHPETKFFYTHFYYLDDNTGEKSAPELWNPVPEPQFQVSRFFLGPYVHGNSIAVHKSVFERVGNFNAALRNGQDFDMWLRISARFPSRFIDSRSCVTRWHKGQSTNVFPDAGFYDSARALAAFVNDHGFAELFPLLDLTQMQEIVKAVQETLTLSVSPNAMMHRLGPATALLERLHEWMDRTCPAEAALQLRRQIAKLAASAAESGCAPKLISALADFGNEHPGGYRFRPHDFLADAAAFQRQVAAAGQKETAQSLERYLAPLLAKQAAAEGTGEEARQDEPRAGSGRLRILVYYGGLHNSVRPFAGSSNVSVQLARQAASLDPGCSVTLAGDHVTQPEQLGEVTLVPLPGGAGLQGFLAGFDVVVLATHLGAFAALPKPRGQLWILHQHCWDLNQEEWSRLADFDLILCLTQLQRRHYLDLGIPAARLAVLGNGIDTGLFSPRPVPRKPHSIMFSGAVVPHKGVHLLLQAFGAVRRRFPDAELDIYGSASMWRDDPGYEQRLASLAPEGVSFRGALPNAEMPEVYARHSVLCVPSQLESFGLATVEAQACGCFPIVNEVGGTPETVLSGSTGFLYSPNTPELLADRIAAAFTALDADAGIRQRCVEFARERFSLQEQGKTFLALVHALAREKEAARRQERLPIHFFTIVLNGEPFIRRHAEIFQGLDFPWHWHIVEGVAELKHDTAWSLNHGGRITEELHSGGLSNDGTSEYLDRLAADLPQQVTVYRKRGGAFWEGKREMVAAPLANIQEECILWQVDADEIWSTRQIRETRELFLRHPEKSAAYFYCNFHVGDGLRITTRNTYGNHPEYEWLRAWRYLPGDAWLTHEPPRLCRQGADGSWSDIAQMNPFRHDETEARQLVFEHYAYVTEPQLRFKEIYYGYADAVAGWRRLQRQDRFPVYLREYFPWVRDEALVDRVPECRATLPEEVSSIVFLRPDSIGDSVLAASILPSIKKRYPEASITVFCQERVAELYQASPFVDAVIGFDLYRAFTEEPYRLQVLRRLKEVRADLLLNSLYSRDPLYDFFAVECGAKKTVAFEGDLSNIDASQRLAFNGKYGALIPSAPGMKPELKRHEEFLNGLGIDPAPLAPVVWTSADDDRFAEEFFRERGLDPGKCIALFAGAQSELRIYGHYGKALSAACRDRGFTVLAFGAGFDAGINQQNLDECGIPGINLSGKLTLRQTAALVRQCRLAVGAETGTAHIACAVGTPNVILVGGGHFGRFMPYSPLTSVVCLPLQCYFCNWNCGFQRSHCVKDVHPDVFAEAIRQTLASDSDETRIFCQGSEMLPPVQGEPAWQGCERLLGSYPYRIIPVNPAARISAVAHVDSQKPGPAGPALQLRGEAPKISLVIPSYNYGQYLEACLDSILSQNYPNLELLILDGGSTDNTVEIIKRHEKHLAFWRSAPDAGQYSAIEEGLNRGSGEIMTWLNADDMFHPGAFQKVASIFSQAPEVEWLMGRPNSFDESGRQKHVHSYLPLNSRAKYLADEEFIQQEGVFWRRSLWERSGTRIDRELPLAADLELWARFFRSARLFSVDALVAGFRDHPLQKSKDKAGYTAEANRVLARERALFAREERPYSPPAPLPILLDGDKVIL